MKEKRKIPKFSSIAEGARFWDTHDVTDYLSEMKEVDSVFAPSGKKRETLTLRIQPNVKRRIKEIAKDYGITPSALTRLWVVDKLKESETSS